MTGFGETFRNARLATGQSIDDISKVLHIRATFLQALENEKWDDLPKAPYAQGLVKNYANYLGLDVGQILESFHAVLPQQKPQTIMVQLDEPLVDHARSQTQSTRTVIAILAGIVIVVAAWYAFARFYLEIDPFAAFRRPTITQETVAPTSILPTAMPTIISTPMATPISTSAPTSIPQPTATATPAPPTNTPQVSGVSLQLDIRATCWTQVIVDGETAFVGTLQQGDSVSYSGTTQIQLTLGNAGGVNLQVNGVDQGLAGASGQVANFTFDADS